MSFYFERGRGVAWLSFRPWESEIGGSNPPALTSCILKDCRLKCTNGEYIPCNTSEDCSFESMSAFCGGTKNVILKSGLTGYCSKGYCYSYGCGGVPSID